MGKSLRKQITLPAILGHEITVDVTHRLIAVLEEVYDSSLDSIIQWDLANPLRVKRSKVAECIANWIGVAGKLPEDLRRREVLDYVMGAHADELNRFIGALQGAALYCTRDADGEPRIDEEDFAKLLLGQSVDVGKKKRVAEEKANGEDREKKATPPPPTSDESTTSPS